MKLCLDLSRCYYPHWGRLAWAVCLKLLVELFKVCQKLKLRKNAESLLEICKSVEWISNFKRCWSVKQIRILVCSLGLLVALLLLWGCSTSQSSRYSAPSSLTQPLLPSHHQKTKKQSQSSLDSSNSQVEQTSQRASLLDTSLLSQSPLWEQSSDSTSLLEGEKVDIDRELDLLKARMGQ